MKYTIRINFNSWYFVKNSFMAQLHGSGHVSLGWHQGGRSLDSNSHNLLRAHHVPRPVLPNLSKSLFPV